MTLTKSAEDKRLEREWRKIAVKRRARLSDPRALHIMLIPGVLFVFTFAYLPLAGLVMAFQDFKPLLSFTGSRFVGFKQFAFLFSMQGFWEALRNTFIIAFFKITLCILFPLVISLCLNEVLHNFYKRFVQTVIFIPYFFSWAILGGIVLEVFGLSGVINQAIVAMGGEQTAFLISNKHFRTIIIATDVWKAMGYNTVLFLAALTNIDPTLYESANVDGAGRIRQLTHITIPSITPMIVLLTILGLGGILNAGFEQILILYNPVVQRTVDIIDTFVYRTGIISAQYSVAAAAGLFKSIVALVFVGGSYYVAYKTTDYRVF